MISRTSTGKLLVALLVPLTAVVPLLFILAFSTSQPALADDRESITIRWKSPVTQPVCLAMSTGGKFFGSVDRDGTVRFYDQNGDLLWEQQVEGATDVLIAKNGESLLVYSKLNPVYQDVHFFRKDGSRLWEHRVEGSVWSGAISVDGTRAAVSTGERYIYVYRPDPMRPRYRRWRTDGIGYQVTFTADNKHVIVGTWQESGLACYDLDGRFQWRSRYDTDRQYQLHASADGKTMLGLLPATQHDPGIEVWFRDSGGKVLWQQSLDGFDARARVSPQSQYVAISYAKFLAEADPNMIERKVAVYGSDGHILWEKGGLFFGPRLVALSPKGSSVIVSDGERSLYNMDKRGKILSKLTLGGTVRSTVSSEDGQRILLYCGDGWLYLISVG